MFGTAKSPGRRARSREAKRERILAAARRLLLRRGPEEISLREVARAARVSPAGMYEFFESKTQLLEELGTRASVALAGALARAARPCDEPGPRLVAMGLAYVGFALQNPEEFLLLFGRVVARRSLAQEVPPESPYGRLRAGVAAVVGERALRQADPRMLEGLGYGFWSTVHGMAMLRLTNLAGFEADFDAASRVVLESIVAGWGRLGKRR